MSSFINFLLLSKAPFFKLFIAQLISVGIDLEERTCTRRTKNIIFYFTVVNCKSEIVYPVVKPVLESCSLEYHSFE